ncbi:hypothetical protein NBRC116493_03260 [Aurantivibrio infirmus]
MSDSQVKQLLICQNEGCEEQFVDEINEELEGDAASLPSALKAHKAGWQIVEGKIFCPRCAKGKASPN